MKTGLWISSAFVAIVALVFIALTVGWAVWGRQLWRAGSFVAAGGCGDPQAGARPGLMGRGFGPGIMPGATALGAGPAVPGGCGTGLAAPGGCGPGPSVPGGCAAAGQAGSTAVLSGTLTIEQARQAVERYVAGLGDSNLAVGEVMEFEQNFYAIVKESDTNTGALEVLVDKRDGAVFPEMGPNMMWNGRYGMHSRMMPGAVAPGRDVSRDQHPHGGRGQRDRRTLAGRQPARRHGGGRRSFLWLLHASHDEGRPDRRDAQRARQHRPSLVPHLARAVHSDGRGGGRITFPGGVTMFASALITFRERLEAALIVGIVLGVLRKLGHAQRGGSVWAGVGAAVIASVAVGLILNALGVAFEGRGEQIFEGVAMLLAAVVLTWMIFWMQRQGRHIQAELESDVRRATAAGSGWALFGLVFVAVLREGVETAPF